MVFLGEIKTTSTNCSECKIRALLSTAVQGWDNVLSSTERYLAWWSALLKNIHTYKTMVSTCRSQLFHALPRPELNLTGRNGTCTAAFVVLKVFSYLCSIWNAIPLKRQEYNYQAELASNAQVKASFLYFSSHLHDLILWFLFLLTTWHVCTSVTCSSSGFTEATCVVLVVGLVFWWHTANVLSLQLLENRKMRSLHNPT